MLLSGAPLAVYAATGQCKTVASFDNQKDFIFKEKSFIVYSKKIHLLLALLTDVGSHKIFLWVLWPGAAKTNGTLSIYVGSWQRKFHH